MSVEGTHSRFSTVFGWGDGAGRLRWNGQCQLNFSACNTPSVSDGGREALRASGGGASSRRTSTTVPFSSTDTISERASSTLECASGTSGP